MFINACSIIFRVTDILAMRFIRPIFALPYIFQLLESDLYKKQNNGIKEMHSFTDNIIEQRRKILLEHANTNESPKDEGE